MITILKRWFTPRPTAADIAKLRAEGDRLYVDLCIAQGHADAAMRMSSETQQSLQEWQSYTQGLAKVVMAQDRELAALKAANVPAGLDGRLARLELMCLQPISDGALELSEARERAESRALASSGGEANEN